MSSASPAMVPEIISFSKSMACRLQEFQNLLSEVEAPCSEIKEVWSSIFHDLVIPNFGWRALWVMSEESCKKYDVMYPTAVIVTVDNYDWDDISATITVSAVQDDVNLPPMLDIPVIELHPIKFQEFNKDDLLVIADWLDKCRYFFKYLWYPWDAEMDVKISEWCESHLESRLQIQWDIQNGLIDTVAIRYYKSLIDEARKIDITLSELTLTDLSREERINVISNCLKRKILKMELEFFEEPDLRNDLILLRQRQKDRPSGDSKKVARFVWEGGNIDTLTLYLTSIKSCIHNEFIVEISKSIDDALESSASGDTIFLPPGSHSVKSLMGLESGGSIKGIDSLEKTKIVADQFSTRKAILLECFGNLELENLTILRQEGIAIQLFANTLKISNCRLTGNHTSTLRGIVVLSGSTLVVENCQIVGFGIGIVLQKGAKVSISNSVVSECFGGIKMTDKSQVSLTGVEISNCTKYAILMESSKVDSDLPLSGDPDTILQFAESNTCNFQSVVFKDNRKCNVMIKKSMGNFSEELSDFDVSNDTIVLSESEEDLEPNKE